MAEEKLVDGRELRRRAERYHGELLRIRKQVESTTRIKGVYRPSPDFDRLEKAGLADLIEVLDEDLVDLVDLVDLAIAINRVDEPELPEKPSTSHRQIVGEDGDSYRIDAPDGILNCSVKIAKVGSDIVFNPRVVVNGQRNWYSTQDILSECVDPEMNDREKVLAIWKFLVENRYHDSPAHGDIEMRDPVRFLNIYGYGVCDDSATTFMRLSEQAGVRARVWGLSGHVVPEAYYEGAWHMLDSDGEIYYLDDDGHTISSIETLEKRPDIIRNY